jgi:hypothetical protein
MEPINPLQIEINVCAMYCRKGNREYLIKGTLEGLGAKKIG